jgi:phage replication O-like protein O
MSSVVSIETARQERMSSDKPALNDGYCRVVNALVEGLASHPITSVQQRIVWGVIRMTYGWGKGKDRVAASQLSQITGMRRQVCSSTLNELIEMGVIIREGGSRSAIKMNTNTSDWTFQKKATKGLIKERVTSNSNYCSVNSNSGHSTNSNSGHTKDKRKSNSNTPYYSSSPSENQAPAPDSKSPKKNPCPYEEIRNLYHKILPGNPECVVLSENRKSKMRQRWNSKVKSTHCNDLDFWKRFFEFVAKSKFLTGRAIPAKGRKVFVASLTWLIEAENFAKVIEIHYHDDDELGGGEA